VALVASELYLQSDLRLSAKLVPTFADRSCRVVSATDPYGRNLDFLDRVLGPITCTNYGMTATSVAIDVCVAGIKFCASS
jgi:hypothetical protein